MVVAAVGAVVDLPVHDGGHVAGAFAVDVLGHAAEDVVEDLLAGLRGHQLLELLVGRPGDDLHELGLVHSVHRGGAVVLCHPGVLL